MKEKIECKNTQLSFNSEGSMTIFPSLIGDYFKNFPFENFDFELISTRPDELSTLIEELNKYFKSYKTPFQFPSGVETGVVYYPHEIWIDRTRLEQLKNGFIPVYVLFFDPYIPNSKGEFSWDV
jgi:hypothetical protein